MRERVIAMNDNYFLAISVRTTSKRYFLGTVCCAKNKVKYDLKLTEKHGLQFDERLADRMIRLGNAVCKMDCKSFSRRRFEK